MQSQSKMSRRAAAAILVAMTMCLPAAYAAEKSFDRTLSVNGPVTLRVSTGSGYIRVSPGSDNQVHIVGHVKSNGWGNNWFGGSSDDAVAKVAANPPIDQAGNILRIGDDHGSDWGHHVSIDYEITTPANTMLASSGSKTICVMRVQCRASGRFFLNGADGSSRKPLETCGLIGTLRLTQLSPPSSER